jgi:L-seryl-tRNA(Ser) seleniumtransferase
VNNCAGAVLLLLAATARGRPVIVSRGELVEIGGGFRVPEIMAESGATLVEVGTTNRTRLADYERALDVHPDAAALLRVHQGNFRQLGFVERPELGALGVLARSRGVLLLKDLGGGAAIELESAGFPGEPLVQACVTAGCSAVTFSTDKVLGGPQGGVIVGSATIVDRVRKHPLARALRLGRLPMVALEATLEAYLLGSARQEIPTLAMAHAPLHELEARVSDWARQLEPRGITCQLTPSETEMGGGTLAARTVPSMALGLSPTAELGVDEIARRLRTFDPPVAARVTEGAILLDARTVRPDEDGALIRAVVSAYRA